MTLTNLKIPLIQGGMGIGVSLGNLAGAVAKEGAMGVISTANTGYREADFYTNSREANKRALSFEIKKAKEIACGNGLVAINAMVATKDYAEMVKEAVKSGVDAIISGAGVPLALPEIVGNAKVLLAPIVSSAKAASTICKVWKRKYDKLPDFIVIEGVKAGGHLGFNYDEIKTAKSLMTILKEVKEITKSFGDIPVFVAGGILSKKEIKEFIENGATGIQVATPFIATYECDASIEYKEQIIKATDEDVTIIKSPVGMPGRAINTALTRKLLEGRIKPQFCTKCLVTCSADTTPFCITSALISAVKGDLENGLFFCSESVGKVNKMQSVKEVIESLMGDII